MHTSILTGTFLHCSCLHESIVNDTAYKNIMPAPDMWKRHIHLSKLHQEEQKMQWEYHVGPRKHFDWHIASLCMPT